MLDHEAVDRLLVDVFLRAHGEAPEQIILDLDATDDPLYGKQEGRFFHGYYGHYCYLPLYIFCGEFLLCARLRSSNIDGAAGSVEELQRIVKQIRSAWSQVRIIVRGDSGFCREELMAWCEAEDVDYLLGLAKNERLKAEIQDPMAEAEARYRHSGQAARVFHEFFYQTRESWSRARRVVAKAEYLEKGENPRFIVTSLPQQSWPAQPLYEQHYCARGDMENRIKEQLMLFADRTSTAYLRSNQLRLYFSSVAYVLLQMLRRLGLQGTELAHAQCATIRLKLLKIGALIRITVRKVWVSLAGGYPYAELFWQIHAKLSALPLRWVEPARLSENSLRSHSFGKEGCSVRADLPPPQTNPLHETRLANRFCFVIRTCSPVLPISTSPIRTGEKYGLTFEFPRDLDHRVIWNLSEGRGSSSPR